MCPNPPAVVRVHFIWYCPKLLQDRVCLTTKKGSRCEPSNYRPVTLTSHIVKVYERVVRKHIVHYFETNNLLTDKQHGFRSNRRCLTQMLDHFDDIYEGFTRGEDTDSIYLNYAKAFDKVDLDLLILKLKKYGFGNKLVD